MKFKRRKKVQKPLPGKLPKDGAEQPDRSVHYDRWPNEGRSYMWPVQPKPYKR